MKTIKVKNKNLNKGKITSIYYSVSDTEIKAQIREIYEREHYKKILEWGGDTLIDLGANSGLVSLYAKDHFKKIYAIEPNPQIFDTLVKNTGKYKNIIQVPFGITCFTGKYYMYNSTDANSQAQSFYITGDILDKIAVDSITIDKLFEKYNINKVDVMKIDVEGSEFYIFPHKKSFGKVAKRIKHIIGEGHFTANQCFPEAIPEILKQYGYETSFINHKPANYARFLDFTDPDTGEKDRYMVPFNTVFIASQK